MTHGNVPIVTETSVLLRPHGGYGWKPSLPDIRDFVYDTRGMTVLDTVDLRTTNLLPGIWDQGQLGSCTAHGSGAGLEYDVAKQGGTVGQTPSRLFLYFNARSLEGTTSSDSGASVADALKSTNKWGAPPESDWAYDISKFADKPPAQAYTDGVLCESIKYASVPQTVSAIQAILSSGYPVVIGFTVYESFESDAVAANGIMPMPASGESVLGGHCVLVVGYKTINGAPYWICRNSWGTGWGDAGYFYMPQAYLTNSNLSSDFWVIQQTTSPDPTPAPPSPTPTPTPSPSPSPTPAPDADAALVAAGNNWAKNILAELTKAGKLKAAFENWKSAHNY